MLIRDVDMRYTWRAWIWNEFLYVLYHKIMAWSVLFFFFSSRRRHTRCSRDWSSDVCSSDLGTYNSKSFPAQSVDRGGKHGAASESRPWARRDARVGGRVRVPRWLDSRGRRRVPRGRLARAHVGAGGNGPDGHAFRAEARFVRCSATRARSAAHDPRLC